jgi:hypothetical protein
MAAIGTYQAQLISQAIVDDSSWEPDGVTLQVRFCEGGELYRVTGRLAATLQCLTLPFFVVMISRFVVVTALNPSFRKGSSVNPA